MKEAAIRSFDRLGRDGVMANAATYAYLLKDCSKITSLTHATQVHSWIIQSGLENDLALGNQLMRIYGQCGSLEQARRMFDQMRQRNLVSWNMMIGVYTQHEQGDEALHLFHEMRRQEVKPDIITYISILSACDSPAALAEGKLIHDLIVGNELKVEGALGNALLSMYGKCGSPADARRIFDTVFSRGLISWNAMIATYAQNSQPEEAILLFEQLLSGYVKPDKVTFLGILNACSKPEFLEKGKLVHSLIIVNELEDDAVVGTALLNMYGKCGDLDLASTIFGRLLERNVISWTAMIAAYVQNGYNHEALGLFRKMGVEGVKPNKVTFISSLEACGNLSAIGEGKLIHALLIDLGIELDVVLGTALVSMYSKCWSLVDAISVFDKLPKRNPVSWNVIIAAHVEQGFSKQAYQLVQKMNQKDLKPDRTTFITILKICNGPDALGEGKRIHGLISDSGLEQDVVVGTALVSMYGRCGSPENAWMVFEKMPEHNVVTWNAMITACTQHGRVEEAFQLFRQMCQEGFQLDKVTIINILETCITLAEGKMVHVYILDSGVDIDTSVGNAFINMYGKCGSLQYAQIVFDNMKLQNVVSWSAMIAAFTQHGYGKEALVFFQRMCLEGVKPDKVTFVSVLSACSHAGLINEGLLHFDSMTRDHGIKPHFEHYTCMIDLLGRAGQFNEAECFILKMPTPPRVGLWMTLLGACRIHGNLEHGERAAKHALELDPQSTAPYVVLSNIYAAVGRWDDALNLRRTMVEKGSRDTFEVALEIVHEE